MNKNRTGVQQLTTGCLGVRNTYFFREKEMGKERWVSTCKVTNPAYGIVAILPVVAMDLTYISLLTNTFQVYHYETRRSGSMCLL